MQTGIVPEGLQKTRKPGFAINGSLRKLMMLYHKNDEWHIEKEIQGEKERKKHCINLYEDQDPSIK